MKKYIESPVELGFDPSKMAGQLERIFKDKVARIFWLGIGQKHVRYQYFNEYCLKASEVIEKDGAPKSEEELKTFLGKHFHADYGDEFVEEFLPYVVDEKNLEYEVVLGKRRQ